MVWPVMSGPSNAPFVRRCPVQGEKGRPRLVAWAEIQIVQVVKQRSEKHFQIERRIVQGTVARSSNCCAGHKAVG